MGDVESMHYLENEMMIHQTTKQKRTKSAFEALGQAAAPFFRKKKTQQQQHQSQRNNHQHEVSDKLPRNCQHGSWHTLSFPNCNDVHDIDLRKALHISKYGQVIPADLGEGDKSEHKLSHGDKVKARKMGYLGSGLWRQVWMVQPRGKPISNNDNSGNGSGGEEAVLKMMKSEHPIDQRNFDRHRRDALVMERLTSSPNVISMHGFCGNTVLTEHGGMTLDEYIFDDHVIENNSTMEEQQHQQYGEYTKFDRTTSLGKLQLSLEVIRGIQALHNVSICVIQFHDMCNH